MNSAAAFLPRLPRSALASRVPVLVGEVVGLLHLPNLFSALLEVATACLACPVSDAISSILKSDTSKPLGYVTMRIV